MHKRFINQKAYALQRYYQAKNLGEVDEGIISLLDYLNSLDDYYTTSSCAGRITLLYDHGSKKQARWLGKWHRRVKPDEIIDCLKLIPSDGIIWFRYESPILHVVARTVDKAQTVLYVAREAGYKRVGLQGLKKERFLVEICDTERVDAPIAEEGGLLVDDKYLKHLALYCNKRYVKGNEKIAALESALRRNLG